MKYIQNFRQLDLTGKWQFIYSDKVICEKTIEGIKKSGVSIYDAVVPGNFELDLQRNSIIADPYFGKNIKLLREFEKMYICYFRTFEFSPVNDTNPYLVFEGLDCIADVYLNGRKIMSAQNMMIPQVSPAESFVIKGTNEILVLITPPSIEALKHEYPAAVSGFHANYESLYIRKPAHMFGWDILPRLISGGIFRPVYIEFRTEINFSEVYLQTAAINDDSAETVFFYKCNFDKAPGDVWSIRLSGECGLSSFTENFLLSFQNGKHQFSIQNPQLWNVRGRGKINLYSITAGLYKNNVLKSSVKFNHGIRTIMLKRKGIINKGDRGEFEFIVNGKRVFVKGTNWVAADALHSRDKNRIPRMIEMADDINCNMIRCWGGNLYEDDIFYEMCDSLGILIWQDFAMACAVYPQDSEFSDKIAEEAASVIKRLRQHPCLALWAGDNECDQAHSWFGFDTDPNTNRLTRVTLPDMVRQHDPFRSYLPSSPYIDSYSFNKGEEYLPENHLWGIRDYFKSDYYVKSTCRFASEMGYHGCPSPESIIKFISKDCVWPYDNEEWLLHSTSPLPKIDKRYNFRVELMANQIKVLFGEIPDNLEDFSRASQISQAEAKKFFIEHFRGDMWNRTGILWWNLVDGWPQFSDAVVDYYFTKKLAYDYIKKSQRELLLMFREPMDGKLELVASNCLSENDFVEYMVTDSESGLMITKGSSDVNADSVATLGHVDYDTSEKHMYIIKWKDSSGTGTNHYLSGKPPFDFNWYVSCIMNLD